MKKALPEPASYGSELFKLPQDVARWELLKTAMELKLFDRLKEPVLSKTVAEALALDPANTEFVLNALTAIGCLKKEQGRFCNSPLAEKHLVSGTDTYLADALLFMENWNKPLINGGLKTLLKEGAPPPQPIGGEEIWAVGARMSLNHSRSGRAQRFASFASRLPEFASVRKILDLGAGPGIIGIAVTAAHPDARCVLFDRAPVLAVAEEVIREYGLEERVSAMPGDYAEDPIGDGYDLIIASYTLNFYRDRLPELMGKFLDALNPGGALLVATDGLTDERTAPAAMIVSMLSTMLQGMDMSFNKGEVVEAMLQAGFQSTQSETINDEEFEAHGPVELIVARKATRP